MYADVTKLDAFNSYGFCLCWHRDLAHVVGLWSIDHVRLYLPTDSQAEASTMAEFRREGLRASGAARSLTQGC